MAYFTPEFTKFFQELKDNNHKEWFHENRSRYDKYVKKSFENFISDLIFEISERGPRLMIEPKHAIFRINRDIRFSKNKEPYKLTRSAVIGPGGKKNRSIPTLYLEISLNQLRIGTGQYDLDKEQLKEVRYFISSQYDRLQSILNDKNFKDIFGEMLGSKNKRLPTEFNDIAEDMPELYHKQFYFMHDMPLETIYQDDLIERILEVYEVSRPVREYFTEAIGE